MRSAVAPPPPPQQLPGPARPARHNSALSIPGAFGTDDDDNDHDGAVDKSAAPAPLRSPTTMSATTTAAPQQQPSGDATFQTPEIAVKWNEKTDVIMPKVRGERERIERLVLEQKQARSESPSAIASVPLSPPPPPPPPSPPQPPVQPAGQAAAAASSEQEEKDDASTPGQEEKDDANPPEQEEKDDANTLQVFTMQSDDHRHPEPVQDDDFDDFGETVEADGDGFNDFDGFAGFDEGNATDGGFADAPPPPAAVAAPLLPPSPPATPSVALPDFGDTDSTHQMLVRAVERMFPRPAPGAAERENAATTAPGEGRAFLTDRR